MVAKERSERPPSRPKHSNSSVLARLFTAISPSSSKKESVRAPGSIEASSCDNRKAVQPVGSHSSPSMGLQPGVMLPMAMQAMQPATGTWAAAESACAQEEAASMHPDSSQSATSSLVVQHLLETCSHSPGAQAVISLPALTNAMDGSSLGVVLLSLGKHGEVDGDGTIPAAAHKAASSQHEAQPLTGHTSNWLLSSRCSNVSLDAAYDAAGGLAHLYSNAAAQALLHVGGPAECQAALESWLSCDPSLLLVLEDLISRTTAGDMSPSTLSYFLPGPPGAAAAAGMSAQVAAAAPPPPSTSGAHSRFIELQVGACSVQLGDGSTQPCLMLLLAHPGGGGQASGGGTGGALQARCSAGSSSATQHTFGQAAVAQAGAAPSAGSQHRGRSSSGSGVPPQEQQQQQQGQMVGGGGSLDGLFSQLRLEHLALAHVPCMVTIMTMAGDVVFQNGRSIHYLGDCRAGRAHAHAQPIADDSAEPSSTLRALFSLDAPALDSLWQAVTSGQHWSGLVRMPPSPRMTVISRVPDAQQQAPEHGECHPFLGVQRQQQGQAQALPAGAAGVSAAAYVHSVSGGADSQQQQQHLTVERDAGAFGSFAVVPAAPARRSVSDPAFSGSTASGQGAPDPVSAPHIGMPWHSISGDLANLGNVASSGHPLVASPVRTAPGACKCGQVPCAPGCPGPTRVSQCGQPPRAPLSAQRKVTHRSDAILEHESELCGSFRAQRLVAPLRGASDFGGGASGTLEHRLSNKRSSTASGGQLHLPHGWMSVVEGEEGEEASHAAGSSCAASMLFGLDSSDSCGHEAAAEKRGSRSGGGARRSLPGTGTATAARGHAAANDTATAAAASVAQPAGVAPASRSQPLPTLSDLPPVPPIRTSASGGLPPVFTPSHDSTLQSCCWHEVEAHLVKDCGVPGAELVVVVQTDVTERVRTELELREVLDAEHKLLEETYPRHVIEVMIGADIRAKRASYSSVQHSVEHNLSSPRVRADPGLAAVVEEGNSGLPESEVDILISRLEDERLLRGDGDDDGGGDRLGANGVVASGAAAPGGALASGSLLQQQDSQQALGGLAQQLQRYQSQQQQQQQQLQQIPMLGRGLPVVQEHTSGGNSQPWTSTSHILGRLDEEEASDDDDEEEDDGVEVEDLDQPSSHSFHFASGSKHGSGSLGLRRSEASLPGSIAGSVPIGSLLRSGGTGLLSSGGAAGAAGGAFGSHASHTGSSSNHFEPGSWLRTLSGVGPQASSGPMTLGSDAGPVRPITMQPPGLHHRHLQDAQPHPVGSSSVQSGSSLLQLGSSLNAGSPIAAAAAAARMGSLGSTSSQPMVIPPPSPPSPAIHVPVRRTTSMPGSAANAVGFARSLSMRAPVAAPAAAVDITGRSVGGAMQPLNTPRAVSGSWMRGGLMSPVTPGMGKRVPSYPTVSAADCQQHLARHHPSATVMFADICSFTSMCSELPPATVMSFLNSLFSTFDALVERHGADDLRPVYKVETIGDAYMVCGGIMEVDGDGMRSAVSEVDPDHARKVFDLAVDMLHAARNVRLPHTGGPLQLRIGLHCGPCLSGVVGMKMPRWCLYGDLINTASRCETTCVPGCIHVTAEARQLIAGDDPNWQKTGGVQAKGKGILDTYLWVPPWHENSTV